MIEVLNESEFKIKVFDYTFDESQWANIGTNPCCVSFFQNGCSFCLDIEENINLLIEKYTNINFYKINCDDNPDLSRRLKILSVPVILFVPLKGEPRVLKGIFSERFIEFLIKDVLV